MVTNGIPWFRKLFAACNASFRVPLMTFAIPSGSRGLPCTIKTTCPLPFGTPDHGLARGYRGVTVSLHQGENSSKPKIQSPRTRSGLSAVRPSGVLLRVCAPHEHFYNAQGARLHR